jgi:hypothetical protein
MEILPWLNAGMTIAAKQVRDVCLANVAESQRARRSENADGINDAEHEACCVGRTVRIRCHGQSELLLLLPYLENPMKILASVCFALALSASVNAYAVTSLEDGSSFSKIVNVDSGFAFTHTYSFHLDFSGLAMIGASVQELKLGDLMDIDWADTNAFVVRDAANNVLFSAGENGNPIGSFSFDNLSLAARDFSITLSGEAIGKLDPAGTYAISLIAAAAPAEISPVPETSSVAMLLGGLGLLGVFARRRVQA